MSLTGGPYSAQIQQAIDDLLSSNPVFSGTVTADELVTDLLTLDITNRDVQLSRLGARALFLGPTTGVTLDWTINGYLQVLNAAGNAPAAISGSVIVANSGIYAASLTFGAAGNSTQVAAPANAQLNVFNNAGTAGVGLDVATDAILKVRNRAQNGYATVDALGYQASGTPGVSGTFTTVTTVNGIVVSGS